VTVVKNPNFPKLDMFPKAQTVAFNYYLGRLNIFEEHYDKVRRSCKQQSRTAEVGLIACFCCAKSGRAVLGLCVQTLFSQRTKEQTADFAVSHSCEAAGRQIPAPQTASGTLRVTSASVSLFLRDSRLLELDVQKYKLLQFDSLIQAIRTGNLKVTATLSPHLSAFVHALCVLPCTDAQSFNESLERHQEFFIKKGIFLILEKLKTFVYRNLFRKAYDRPPSRPLLLLILPLLLPPPHR
jgi:hypothetical protein